MEIIFDVIDVILSALLIAFIIRRLKKVNEANR